MIDYVDTSLDGTPVTVTLGAAIALRILHEAHVDTSHLDPACLDLSAAILHLYEEYAAKWRVGDAI